MYVVCEAILYKISIFPLYVERPTVSRSGITNEHFLEELYRVYNDVLKSCYKKADEYSISAGKDSVNRQFKYCCHQYFSQKSIVNVEDSAKRMKLHLRSNYLNVFPAS